MKLGTVHSDDVLTLVWFITWTVLAWLIPAFIRVRRRLMSLEKAVADSKDFQLHWVAASTTASTLRPLPERDAEAEELENRAGRFLTGSKTQWD